MVRWVVDRFFMGLAHWAISRSSQWSTTGMCHPVCRMIHIKEPLLLIGKSSPCGGSGFPLSLSEWSFTICLTPYNRKYNVLSVSLNETFPSFLLFYAVYPFLSFLHLFFGFFHCSDFKALSNIVSDFKSGAMLSILTFDPKTIDTGHNHNCSANSGSMETKGIIWQLHRHA